MEKDMTAKPPESQLAANIRYGHQQGWSFTPLAGKRPKLSGWQKRSREQLTEALDWASEGNVGLRTGRISGIVVIDVDCGGDVSGLELPATATVNTGGEGIHLYYRCNQPPGNSSGRLGEHIDVRGEGGQVVFVGSVHPDTGRPYQWAEGLEPWTVGISQLPEHIIERLKAAPAPSGAARFAPGGRSPKKADGISKRDKKYAQMALKLELNALYQAENGTRNESLNRAAFNMGTLTGGEDAIQHRLGQVGLLDANRLVVGLVIASTRKATKCRVLLGAGES